MDALIKWPTSSVKRCSIIHMAMRLSVTHWFNLGKRIWWLIVRGTGEIYLPVIVRQLPVTLRPVCQNLHWMLFLIRKPPNGNYLTTDVTVSLWLLSLIHISEPTRLG